MFFNQFAELQKRPFLEKTNLFYEENVQIGASHIVNKLGNSYMIICEYSLLCIYGIFLFFPTDFFYEDCALMSVWSYKSAIVIRRSSEFKTKKSRKGYVSMNPISRDRQEHINNLLVKTAIKDSAQQTSVRNPHWQNMELEIILWNRFSYITLHNRLVSGMPILNRLKQS